MATQAQVCTVKHLNHTCIVVKDIEEALRFYKDLFGIGPAPVEDIPDQGVKGSLIKVGGTQLELIQPVQPDTGVARFLGDREGAIHHIALEVDDIAGKLALLKGRQVRLVDQQPRSGLSGTIAFIHPAATKGVLIELVQP